jgi:hypothetical protein
VIENIRIDAWFLSRKDGVKLKIQEGSLAYCGPKRTGVFSVTGVRVLERSIKFQIDCGCG